MPIVPTIIFIFLCSSSREFSTEALKCDPLDNVYYHKQLDECRKCETCLIGYGKITLKESNLNIDSVNGPSACIPCRPCKEGYFSDRHAYKCKQCIKCSLFGMFELTPCNSTHNATCSSYKPIANRTTPFQKRGVNSGESVENTKSGTDNGILVTVLSVIVVGLVFGMIALLVYRMRRKCSQSHDLESGSCGYINRDSSVDSQVNRNSGRLLNCDKVISELDDDSNDDETTPLMSSSNKHVPPRQRKRHLTYPFDNPVVEVNDTESNTSDRQKDVGNSCKIEKSYSCTGLTTFGKCSLPNHFGESESNLMKEPPDTGNIKKVYKWDKKYRWSEKSKNSSRNFSVCKFLTEYARDQQDIIKKIQEWENREEMLTTVRLNQVAKYLGPNNGFRRLARGAGLSETDLTNIQYNFKDCVEEQGFQVLQKLRNKEIITSKTDLIDLLRKCGLESVIVKLQGIL